MGLVVRHGRWYLLCYSHGADARRAYRVDRVRGVQVLDDTFTSPADLDPVALLEEHLAVGWEYDVEVVIDAPSTPWRRASPAPRRLEPVDAAATRLVGSTSNPAWYAEQLAAVPASYRIVQCPELRDAARVIGQRLLKAAGGVIPEARELTGPERLSVDRSNVIHVERAVTSRGESHDHTVGSTQHRLDGDRRPEGRRG